MEDRTSNNLTNANISVSHEDSRPLPLALSTDYELLIDSEYRFSAITVTRADGSKLSVVPIIQGTESVVTRRGDADELIREGLKVQVLPAYTDRYTASEEELAREHLGYSVGRIKNPFMSQLKEPNPDGREIVFFEPTPKSLIDIMIKAGHGTPELLDARRAALHGEANPIADVITILCETGLIKSRQSYGQEVTASEEALQKVFRVEEDISNLVMDLCAAGLAAHRFNVVRKSLESGYNPGLIKEVAAGDEEVNGMVKGAWQEAEALAEFNNDDPQQVFVEVHKVGDQYIPLPAIVSTAYEAKGKPGHVGEDSGHTLADIYRDVVNDPNRVSEARNIISNSRIALLSHSLGLGTSTLIAKGRWANWRDHGERLLVNMLGKSRNSEVVGNPDLRPLAAGLEKLGIAVMARDTSKDVKEIECAAAESLGPVRVDVDYLHMPNDRRPNTNGTLMVLSGLEAKPHFEASETEDVVRVSAGKEIKTTFSEANARMHSYLYEALEMPINSMFPLTLGDTQLRVAALYSGLDVAYGVQPIIRWLIEGDKTTLEANASDINKLVSEVQRQLSRHISDWAPDSQAEVASQILFADRVEDPSKTHWVPIKLKPTP